MSLCIDLHSNARHCNQIRIAGMQIRLGHAQEQDMHVLTWTYTNPQGFIHRVKQLSGSFIKPLGGHSILQLERGNQPFVESLVQVPLEQKLRLMRPSACTHAVQEYIPTNACMHACTLCCIWRSFALWRKFCINLKPTVGKSRCSRSSQRNKT